MTKRQKFVISSLLLALGFFLIQFVAFEYQYWTITGLVIFALLLCYWALREGLAKNASLLTLVLPVFFTAGTQLFYLGLENSVFFSTLPEFLRMITRILLVIVYTLGIYALLLTSNIYTVAQARTIQLLRSAHAVGFVMTLLTGFFLFNAIFSFRLDFWVNGITASLVSFPLMLQGLWSIDLEERISKELFYDSVGIALIVGQIATILSFWPITVTVASLALTTVVYVGLGLGQAKLQQRLFGKTIREYLLFGVMIFVIMFITARWGG